MKIITISGPDGSGKSTQIKLLRDYLQSRGKKVYYFHAIDFSIGNKIFFRKHKKNKKSDIGITKSGRLKIQLRKLALLIDIWRFGKLIGKLKRQNYDYILSDRFFYDIIVNIKYLQQKTGWKPGSRQKDFFIKVFSNFLRREIIDSNNFLSVYLQTEPEIIMSRNKRPPRQGLEYLKEKKRIYDSLADNFFRFTLDNSERSKEETSLLLRKKIS